MSTLLTTITAQALRLAPAPAPSPSPSKGAGSGGGTSTSNPLTGIVPDFTVFGTAYTALWQKLMAGIWGLAILIAIGYLIHGILGIAQNRGGHPAALRESRKEALNATIALGGLFGLGLIVAALISIVGA